MMAKNLTPQRSLAGARIRALRNDLGISQAELAGQAGISASYLNLIEHDRRRITGARLSDVARLLQTSPAWLTAGLEQAVTDALAAEAPPPGEAATSFAERFPGWARRVADQAQTIASLKARSIAQETQVARDPAVAAALHQIITSASAIQSTSSILVDGGLDADWQGRFQQNVHDDSQRLSGASAALLRYLETQAGDVRPSPALEIAQWMRGAGRWSDLTLALAHSTIADVVKAARLSEAGADALTRWLEICVNDAGRVTDAGLSAAYNVSENPVAMAQSLSLPLPIVMRRLAMMSEGQTVPEMGLAVCDGAGGLRFIKPITGFAMPEAGGCPLWPLFDALTAVGRPVRAQVAMPDAAPLTAYAVAHNRFADFDAPPVIEALMLVVAGRKGEADGSDPAHQNGAVLRTNQPKPEGPTIRAVGHTCRQCPRTACRARREPTRVIPGIDLGD